MKVKIKNSDEDLCEFNDQAKSKLEAETLSFLNDLVSESYRLENVNNRSGSNPEITSSNVHDAATLLRMNTISGKKSWADKLLGIGVTLLPLLLGLFFDLSKFSDIYYFVPVFILIIATVVVVTIFHTKQ